MLQLVRYVAYGEGKAFIICKFLREEISLNTANPEYEAKQKVNPKKMKLCLF